MIPTYIHTAILLPGLPMPEQPEVVSLAPEVFDPAEVSDDDSIDSLLDPCDETDGIAWLESEADVIYSVDRKKVIKVEDVKVENGVLVERLFCLCHIGEVSASGGLTAGNRNWFSELLSESGFAYIEEGNMEALYEVANGHFQCEVDSAKASDPFPDLSAPHDKSDGLAVIGKRRLFEQTFLGLWSIETSQVFEDIAPEIDDVVFAGEGRVEPIKENASNPVF